MPPWILDKSFSVRGGNNFTSRARGQGRRLLAPSSRRRAVPVRPFAGTAATGRASTAPGKKLTGVGPIPAPCLLPPSDFLDLSCFSVDKTRGDATWHLTYMEKSRFVLRNGETSRYRHPAGRLRDGGIRVKAVAPFIGKNRCICHRGRDRAEGGNWP